MPVDYYPQKTVSELEALLSTLQDRQAKGALVNVTAGGVTAARQVGSGNSRVELEIRRVLYALYLRTRGTDMEGKYTNPYADRVRKVSPSYQ